MRIIPSSLKNQNYVSIHFLTLLLNINNFLKRFVYTFIEFDYSGLPDEDLQENPSTQTGNAQNISSSKAIQGSEEEGTSSKGKLNIITDFLLLYYLYNTTF